MRSLRRTSFLKPSKGVVVDCKYAAVVIKYFLPVLPFIYERLMSAVYSTPAWSSVSYPGIHHSPQVLNCVEV